MINWLHFPDSRIPLTLTTDASNTAIGAVFMQIQAANPEPTEFFFHKLSPHKLVILLSIGSFLGCTCLSANSNTSLLLMTTVYTDHKHLIFYLNMKNPSLRQQHQISYLSKFDIDVRHIKGSHNVVADCLSRADVMSLEFEPILTREVLEQYPPTMKELHCFQN